jgi:hypothetical protein
MLAKHGKVGKMVSRKMNSWKQTRHQPSVHLKKEKGKSKNLQNSYTAHVRLHNCSQEKKSPI